MTLQIDNLTFCYGTINIIDHLSLSLPEGSTSALIGASGSGKTTLLKLILGLLKPNNGSLKFNGSASYLMQEDTLLPWRNVWEQLTLVLEFQNKTSDPIILQELLDVIGLKGSEKKFPHELSGGMKRRVSLAQALLREHSLLLMDEPFSSLDIHSREQMFDLIRTVRERMGSTVLMVTHDYRDAITIADKIFWLHEGTILKDWSVENKTREDPALSGELAHKIRQETASMKIPSI